MGKTSRKKKQAYASRDAANAAAGQIVRIGEKEKCTHCKNWVRFGFDLRLGNPPHRAECGVNAKCDGCDLNLCSNCVTDENGNSRTDWLLCANNNTGTGGSNDCIRDTPIKICSECADVERKNPDAAISVSDMEHQKDFPYIHCGGDLCLPVEGSGGRPRQECRECALSGERGMRICHLCAKIRCIACIGDAKDSLLGLSGETNTRWSNMAQRPEMRDMLKLAFVNDFIKRCGDCGRDVCMECTSEDTLASNMSKMRLFDCKESGCRCINCMKEERMASNIENDTLFKCDECRNAKIKCHNPECDNRFKFTCTRCGKANYCSKECQLAAWSSHKQECHKKKKSSKANGEKKDKEKTCNDKAGAKWKRDEAKKMIDDLKNVHASGLM